MFDTFMFILLPPFLFLVFGPSFLLSIRHNSDNSDMSIFALCESCRGTVPWNMEDECLAVNAMLLFRYTILNSESVCSLHSCFACCIHRMHCGRNFLYMPDTCKLSVPGK